MTAAPAVLLLGTLLSLAGAAGVPAPSPPGRALPPRGRWHHEVAAPTTLRWSVLFRRTDAGDDTRLLVETPGGRWILHSTQPEDRAWTREEVTFPSLGEHVSRVLSHPVPSGVPECAGLRPPDACLVLEGSRGRLAAPLSAFSGRDAGRLKQRASAVVSPAFHESLPGLAPALPIDDLAFYSEDFLALLHPALARPSGTAAPRPPRLPGCAFDATFGYPCTADETRREEWLFRRPVASPVR